MTQASAQGAKTCTRLSSACPPSAGSSCPSALGHLDSLAQRPLALCRPEGLHIEGVRLCEHQHLRLLLLLLTTVLVDLQEDVLQPVRAGLHLLEDGTGVGLPPVVVLAHSAALQDPPQQAVEQVHAEEQLRGRGLELLGLVEGRG